MSPVPTLYVGRSRERSCTPVAGRRAVLFRTRGSWCRTKRLPAPPQGAAGIVIGDVGTGGNDADILDQDMGRAAAVRAPQRGAAWS